MYVKLVGHRASITGGSSSSGIGRGWQDVMNVINRSITQPSQLSSAYWNIPSCIITGTPPTAGIYTTTIRNSSSSTSVPYYFDIDKGHYAKGQGGLAARTRFKWLWDPSYGLRMRYSDINDQNMIPYPTTDYYHANATSSQQRITDSVSSDLLNWASLREIHMIITDHIMVIQIQTGQLETESDYLTHILTDLEYMPSVDNYAYASNNRYSPQVCNWFLWPDVMDRATGISSFVAGTGRIQYMDQYGTYRNSTVSDNSAVAHYSGANNGHNMILNPRPYERVIRMPLSNGDFVNQLVPMFANGSQTPTDQLGDPRNGKLMSFFRTTDDIGRTGTIITDGERNYRVFAVHKSGIASPGATGIYNACYAFPEDNIPFGA